MTSILDDIKHMLNILPDETAFDQDLIIHINSAFFKLTQLGVGLVVGYQIADKNNQWEEFYTDPRLNGVKTYVYLNTKLFFDPPSTGFATEAMQRQIDELGIRLNMVADYG